MVIYYKSAVVEPAGFIYVGKDKFESRTRGRPYKMEMSANGEQRRGSH